MMKLEMHNNLDSTEFSFGQDRSTVRWNDGRNQEEDAVNEGGEGCSFGQS